MYQYVPVLCMYVHDYVQYVSFNEFRHLQLFSVTLTLKGFSSTHKIVKYLEYANPNKMYPD